MCTCSLPRTRVKSSMARNSVGFCVLCPALTSLLLLQRCTCLEALGTCVCYCCNAALALKLCPSMHALPNTRWPNQRRQPYRFQDVPNKILPTRSFYIHKKPLKHDLAKPTLQNRCSPKIWSEALSGKRVGILVKSTTAKPGTKKQEHAQDYFKKRNFCGSRPWRLTPFASRPNPRTRKLCG